MLAAKTAAIAASLVVATPVVVEADVPAAVFWGFLENNLELLPSRPLPFTVVIKAAVAAAIAASRAVAASPP
jgi:hypothetical protein